jgi:hypothetical protein
VFVQGVFYVVGTTDVHKKWLLINPGKIVGKIKNRNIRE